MGGGVAVARAETIAAIWVLESVDNDPMDPMLLLMAVWMRLAVAPALVELDSAPWHARQLLL